MRNPFNRYNLLRMRRNCKITVGSRRAGRGPVRHGRSMKRAHTKQLGYVSRKHV